MGVFDDDPFSSGNDPFSSGSSTPSRGSRLKGLAQGVVGRVSDASSEHLKPRLQEATSSAIDWAADNPDKLEKAGERMGAAAGSGAGGFVVGRLGKKAGKKAGGFLGRKASEKAQEYRSGGSSQKAYDPDDPFSDPFA